MVDMPDIRVIQRACGGRPALARRLNISYAAIQKWTRVPTERVLQVSKICGWAPYQLRPDLPDLFPAPQHLLDSEPPFVGQAECGDDPLSANPLERIA